MLVVFNRLKFVLNVFIFLFFAGSSFALTHHRLHKTIHHVSKKAHVSHHHAHVIHHKASKVSHSSHHIHAKLSPHQTDTFQNDQLSVENKLNVKDLSPQVEEETSLPVPSVFEQTSSSGPLQMANTAEVENDSVSNSTPLTTKQRLVALVNRAVSALHHTSYRLGGGYFDLSRGVYEEDCSGYVDQLLHRAEPQAYATLTQWTHSNKPSSFDYYDFFRKLPDQSWHFWQKVKDIARLKPGAIMVFRYHGHSRYSAGGHVMVVMSQPVPVENHSDTFLVRVSDSANSGHSDDTRARHMSGVGIGTLLLKVNPFTHEPNAYAWKLSGWLEHVDVAMAQPVTPA